MGLAVGSFDRAYEPPGVSTVKWGTRTVIDTYRKLHNRVHDVVYYLGAVGKNPMIRLLTHTAVDAPGMGVKKIKHFLYNAFIVENDKVKIALKKENSCSYK